MCGNHDARVFRQAIRSHSVPLCVTEGTFVSSGLCHDKRVPPIESDLDDALGLGDEDAELVNEVQDDWNASSSAE